MAKPRTNPHEAKVKEIRDAFDEDFQHWDKIYKEGDLNVKFAAGNTWKDEDRAEREENGRPVVDFDEIGQYLNQAQNVVRLNPRAPKFSPEGDGANNDTARVYANALRKAEYRSNAQEAYTTAFDNALTRGYAFVRLKLAFEHPKSFYQHVSIEPVPNPNCCYPDSRSLRVDGCDWKRFSYVESYSKAEFERAFPYAEFTDFSADQITAVGSKWMGADRVQVLEFWEIEDVDRKLTEYEAPATKTKPARFVTVLEGDGQQKPRGGRVVQERVTQVQQVYKYLTNGVELLYKEGEEERETHPGTMIPFAPCYGKMLWVNQGAGPERLILSMVSLARNPASAYCFAAACELEAVGTITKNPYWAYEGSLDPKQKNAIKASLHQPVAVLEAKPTLPGVGGGAVLIPLPVRNPMAIDLSSYAIVKEGARKAIQAAMNFVPMQTSMQRQNQKLSGRALDKMEDSGAKGSYHFTDHYNYLIRRVGVLFEDVFDKINDAQREINTVEADKTVKRVMIGGWNGRGEAPKRPKDLDKAVDYVPSLAGRHDVTVDVGPETESEHQESVEFLDAFITSPLFAAIEPAKRDKLMAMSIKERIQGPTGQKMAEIVDPQPKEGEGPPPDQMKAMLAQAQQQIIPALEAEIHRLQQEAAAKVTETQGKMALGAQSDKTKIEIAAMQVEQKERDSSQDSATAMAIAELRAEIEKLKMGQQRDIEGAKLEHATAMAGATNAQAAMEGGRDREHAAAEGDRGRQHAAAEGDKGRAHTSGEADKDRSVAADAAASEAGE